MARYDVVDFQGLEGPVKKVRKVRRQPIAGDEGVAWVAIGAPRDGPYEPPDRG